MSTRSVIARKTGPGTFKGVYHHWDGYPGGLGATLFSLFNGHFKKQLKPMLEFLIDQHPAGWSTIQGADFTLPAGFRENDWKDADKPHGPACYCHGDRREKGRHLTQANASDSGCEYAYVFSDGDKMEILSSYCGDGAKMIGMFGCGDPDATWSVIGEVDLNGPEPKWDKMG